MDRPPVVLLGGLANALSVARSLGRKGVQVHYLGDTWAGVRFSRYCCSFSAVDEGPELRYLEPLKSLGIGSAVVIPCGDDGLELIARHRSEIEGLGHVTIEANDDAILKLLDKESSYEIARMAGVPAPRTAVVSNDRDLRIAAAEIGFPSALKPRLSHNYAKHFAGKAVVVKDLEQAQRSLEEITSKGLDVVLTEIVPGPEGSYWGYYTYVDENGASLFEFTKRKLRQYPLGFGLGTLHRMEDNPEVIAAGRRLVMAAGVRGLVNAEFKLDSRNGRYVFIECNHRLTAATELIGRSGIDLAGFVYARLIGESPPAVPSARTDLVLWWPFRDTIAAMSQLRTRDLNLQTWLSGIRGRIVLPAFSVSDPMPVVAAILRSFAGVGRHLRRLFARVRS